MALFGRLRSRVGDEGGFTLLELMIVVVTMSVLMLIAVPTFAGAISRAKDRSAQRDLMNSYTTSKAVYIDTQSFSTSNAGLQAAMALAEPAFTFVAGPVPAAGVTNTSVYVQVSAATNGVLLERKSKAGTYFGVAAIAGGAGTKCKTTDPATANAWTITDATTTCSNGW